MAMPPSAVNSRKTRDLPDSFDRWLDEGLHKLYDDVVQAPLPESLLALIEMHRLPASDAVPVVTPLPDGHPGT